MSDSLQRVTAKLVRGSVYHVGALLALSVFAFRFPLALTHLITARIISLSNIMSGSMSHIGELPAEILEHILWYLSGQDIIKMEAVRIPPPRKMSY